MANRTDVSMLWEAVDAASTLTTRFGFADVDHAVSWLDSALREAWTAGMDRCDRIVMSSANLLAWLTMDGQQVIAKCCIDPARFARLAEADALVSWLGAEGLPVATPIAADGGRLRIERSRFSIGLYPVIEGDLLDATDSAQVEAAGRTLASLHQALSVYPGSVGSSPAPATGQLTHGDFRAANILSDGARVTAVLDFDDVANRSRVADLAKSAVLLATQYHDWAPTKPETRDRFVAAHAEIAPLSRVERDELQRGLRSVLNDFGWE